MKLVSTKEFRNKNTTVGSYLESGGKLIPGALFYLKSKSGENFTMLVGHSTPYIQPTTNDGGIGWDWTDNTAIIEKIEFYDYSIFSKDHGSKTYESVDDVETLMHRK